MATPRSNFVKLRLTDLEKQDWQRAAGGARLLSEWIRRVCNAAAQPAVRPGMTDLMIAPELIDEFLNSPEAASEIARLAAEKALAEKKVPLSTAGAIIPNAKPLIVERAIQDSVQGDQAHRESRPLPAAQALDDDSFSGERKSVSSGDGESCPRWMHHRPGVYCGSCKKVAPKGKK